MPTVEELKKLYSIAERTGAGNIRIGANSPTLCEVIGASMCPPRGQTEAVTAYKRKSAVTLAKMALEQYRPKPEHSADVQSAIQWLRTID